MKRKWIWVVLAAIMAVMCAGVVTLVARTIQEDSKAPRTRQGNLAVEEPTPTPTTDDVAAFGANHGQVYDDGLDISIVSVKRYKPTEYAILGEGKVHVLVTVRITNRTDANYDPRYTQVSLAVGPSGLMGSEDIDTQSGAIGATESGLIGRKKTKTFKFGFAIPAAVNPAQVTVTPDSSHQPTLFEGKIS